MNLFNADSERMQFLLISAFNQLFNRFIVFSALDDNGNLTSPLGLQMAEFPLTPMFSKMLLASGMKISTVVGVIFLLLKADVSHSLLYRLKSNDPLISLINKYNTVVVKTRSYYVNLCRMKKNQFMLFTIHVLYCFFFLWKPTTFI